MTWFRVSAARRDGREEVEWRDGALTGDPFLADVAQVAVDVGETVHLGDIWSGRASLAYHLPALATCLTLPDARWEAGTDPPDDETRVSDGAVS